MQYIGKNCVNKKSELFIYFKMNTFCSKKAFCIDKSTDLIYNRYERNFFLKKIKAFVLVYMCLFFLGGLFSVTAKDSSVVERKNEKDVIFLKYEYFPSMNIITVCLCCENGSKFSGLLIGIEYDLGTFSFNSVERGFAKPEYEFTCSLKDNGVIAVLFDGTKPDSGGGELARFSFGIKDPVNENSGEYDFNIVFFDDTPAFYIDKNIMLPLSVEKTGCSVSLAKGGDAVECCGLLRSKVEPDKILIVGDTDIDTPVGFELYVADLTHGKMTFIDCHAEPIDKFLRYENTDNEHHTCLLPVKIKCEGLICIYIVPYVYADDGKVYGIQKDFVFKNKEFIG